MAFVAKNSLKDYYWSESEQIVKLTVGFMSILTLLSSAFIVYLICYQTPRTMANYKKFLLAMIIFRIIGRILAILGRPRIIHQFNMCFTVGNFPLQSPMLTRCLYFLAHCNFLWSSTSVVLLQIERYFTIHSTSIKTRRFWSVPFFVVTLCGINVVLTLSISFSAIFGTFLESGQATNDYVVGINGGEDFLREYPGLVLLNRKRSPSLIIYFGSLIVAATILAVLLFGFLFLNTFSGFRAVNFGKYSTKTKKLHVALLRITTVETILLTIFGAGPIILLLVSFVKNSDIVPANSGTIQVLIHFYCFLDNLIIIFFVRPYKNFVFGPFNTNSVRELNS